MQGLYRARQFWSALAEIPSPDDLSLARELLSPGLMELFLKMQPGEQAHSLRVARRLRGDRDAHPDLFVAALLHDAGKSLFPLRVWERVLIVLGKRLFPKKAASWGNPDNQQSGDARKFGWRRPFVVAEQHPGWGAEAAREAGASPMVVELIRRHQDPQKPASRNRVSEGEDMLENSLLYRLQMADQES